MRKRVISRAGQHGPVSDGDWLDLDQLAEVEITSEDPEHPIESALLAHATSGWQAADGGEQTIRLVFNHPLHIRRIRLEFVETASQRTQQFTLRWQADGRSSFEEIVRQQWNFSPHGSTREVEDYRIDLPDAAVIELTIVPDMGGGDARASLASLRLAS